VSDLFIFLALIGVLLAAGIAVGMIVAGRIDRLLTAGEEPAEAAATADSAVEEGPTA
jgi:hypothetical protein